MVTEEYSLQNHTVQICDLSTDEIAKSNNWIGSNQVLVSLLTFAQKVDNIAISFKHKHQRL